MFEEFLDEIFFFNLLYDVDCKLVLFFFLFFNGLCNRWYLWFLRFKKDNEMK